METWTRLKNMFCYQVENSPNNFAVLILLQFELFFICLGF